MSKRAPSSFIIATRNRPDELEGAVRSLVTQTVLPSELCIVDASDRAERREKIENLCEEAGLKLDYVHPAPRGLTVQRNLGVERTSGDPVFFIDDDVIMQPNVHEEVLAEWAKWGPELGGVRGVPKRPALPAWYTIAFRRIFGIGGWWPEASGKMRSGFFVEGVSRSASPRKLEYFNGWFMSYRRDVVESEKFDEAMSGYAYKEDIDFSWRVARRGLVLIQTPRAVIDHLKTETGRLSPHNLQRLQLANQFYLHRKHMPQTLRSRAALWWALVGWFLLNVGKTVQKRDAGYLTGLAAGAWEQARGGGLIDPAAENMR